MAHTVESAEERQSAWIHREETGEVPPDRGAVGISSVIECVGMKVSVTFQPEECGICYVQAIGFILTSFILEYKCF